MKKEILIAFGITILFLGMSINSSVAIDNVKESSISISNGNTLYVGGTGEGNYTKIQDAINDASDGDTVFVYSYSSPYYENVIIKKSINLIGEDRTTTIVHGQGKDIPALRVKTNYVNVSGFLVQNSNKGIGLSLSNSVNNCTISDNGFFNHYEGIFTVSSSFNVITGNIIRKNERGISMEGGTTNTIVSNNVITDNHNQGIWMTGASKNKIVNNTIRWQPDGITLRNSRDNVFESNDIIDNYKNGIYCWDDANRNLIIQNNIEDNGKGIKLNGKNNIINRNNIMLNQQSIYLRSSNNEIISNNFIGNFRRPGCLDCTNTWNNNFWNRPRLRPKTIFVGESYWIIPPGLHFDGIRGYKIIREYDSNPALTPYNI